MRHDWQVMPALRLKDPIPHVVRPWRCSRCGLEVDVPGSAIRVPNRWREERSDVESDCAAVVARKVMES